MKATIKYLIAGGLMILQSCLNQARQKTTSLAILIDQTDGIARVPNAESIMGQIGIYDRKYEGFRTIVASITDNDVSERWQISVTAANPLTANELERNADIRQFKVAVQAAIDSAKYVSEAANTIAYRPIVRELNRLAAERCDSKYLLVYSNLFEHDGENDVYNRNFMNELRQHPDIIATRLQQQVAFGDLHRIRVWLLYKPKSYSDNNMFMSIANMYKRMLERHGAQVTISADFINDDYKTND